MEEPKFQHARATFSSPSIVGMFLRFLAIILGKPMSLPTRHAHNVRVGKQAFLYSVLAIVSFIDHSD